EDRFLEVGRKPGFVHHLKGTVIALAACGPSHGIAMSLGDYPFDYLRAEILLLHFGARTGGRSAGRRSCDHSCEDSCTCVTARCNPTARAGRNSTAHAGPNTAANARGCLSARFGRLQGDAMRHLILNV